MRFEKAKRRIRLVRKERRFTSVVKQLTERSVENIIAEVVDADALGVMKDILSTVPGVRLLMKPY